MKKKNDAAILPKKEKKTVQLIIYTDLETKKWLGQTSTKLGYSVSSYVHELLQIDKKKAVK